MADPSRESIRAAEDLLEALAELRRTTRTAETDIRKAIKLAVDGADTASALAALSPADTRQTMNEALTSVEAARHAMRLEIFRQGLEEGMSIAALGRAFGFSRQLAQRFAKEARANEPRIAGRR